MAGYQEIFGGSAVWPSNQTYTAIDLTSDITLAWPIESVSSNVIVADLMDFTPENFDGWNVTLPNATGGSNGVTMIISNLSSSLSFNVLDGSGNGVVNVSPGTVWLIYLTDNSTLTGVWRAFQYGAQAGSVNVAAIAGSGLLAIGSSLNQSMPVSAKATNYTVVKDDRASVILWTGAGGTLTLPTPSGVGSGWFINVANKGSGALTVTPTSGLIDGSATKVFTAGTGSAIVFTDGSNYYTVGYGGAGNTSGFDYTTINCAGSDGVNNVITLAGGQLDRISYKCFGILTGTRTIIVPSGVQQYWIDNETTSSGGPWTLSIRTTGQTDPAGGVTVSQPGQAIMYCDGSNVRPATSGIALPLAIGSGGTGATSAPLALTNLGGSAVGIGVFTAPSAATARTTYLGAGAIGDTLFTRVTTSDALTALAGGTMTGGFTTTGSVAVGGNLNVTGQAIVAGVNVISNTVPLNGIYYLGANRLGFSTNTTLAGYFDATQNLILTHPLGIAQGGTSGATVLAAANALGDATAAVSTLAQRTGSGDLFARAYNMTLAVDNATAVDNVVFSDNATNYIRRTSMSHFNSLVTPDSLSTSSGSAPSYSARAWARVSSSGVLLAGQNIASAGRSALGIYFVTFTTAMPNANYAVVATCLHIAANFIMAASEADSTQVVKTTSQVGIYVGVPGASVDTQISVVIYS